MKQEAIPLHRLFFGILRASETDKRIREEAWRWSDGARLVAPERHHITIGILDDHPTLPVGLVESMVAIGGSAAIKPFPIRFNRIDENGGSVVLLPDERNASLTSLRRQIVERMRRRGIRQRQGYSFSPHMTVAYRHGSISSQAIDAFSWAVDEFVLIDSHVGLSHHEVLGRWKLREPAEAQYQLCFGQA